jgi:hypothetical protein
MKKLTFALGVFLTIFGFSGLFPSRAENIKGPVVAELFTSQSCSSCPPADKVLGELATDPNVIALGYHVTYWNHLSWRDTFSLEESSLLQREAGLANGTNRVYTPQMIINGREEFVGSRKSEAVRAIARDRDIEPINISVNNNILTADIPPTSGVFNNLTLMVVGFDKLNVQDIPSGENSGKTIPYTHPVRYIDYPETWNGLPQKLDIPLQRPDITGGYAILIREGRGGPIVAAGQIKF